jgi:hypothetical protein
MYVIYSELVLHFFHFSFSILSFLMFYPGPFLRREDVNNIFPCKFA